MPSKYPGSPAEIRALSAYITLVRAADAVTARVHREITEAGLTEGQFGILEAIHHLGPMRPGELATKILCAGGNVTMIVNNLVRQGLVKRTAQVEDRRCVTVDLTPKGRRLIESIFPAHVARITGALGALTKDEQQNLQDLCRKLGTSIEA